MPKISALTAATALTSDDLFVTVDAPGGTPSSKKITAAIVQRDTQGGVAYTWPGADGSSGQVLTTNGAGVLSWGVGGGSVAIDDLTDVTITTATTGDLLRYNGAAWVNYAGSNYAAASHTHSASAITDFATAADARVAAAIGVSVQAYDADLAAIAGLSSADGNFIVGSATGWVAESGATARTSLGLAIGTNVQAWSAALDGLAADPLTASTAASTYQPLDADLTAIAGLTGISGSLIRHNGTTWVVYADSNYAAASHTHTASQVTDFDTEVSNNADVAANTSARHAAVTVSGTLDYLTLSGQDLVRGAIDLATDITLASLAQYDVLYGASSTGLSRLAGNTTTTKQFLSMTGTGAAAQAPAWSTVSAADVGLGSVENTALSTWAGSTNITTLGTVATGTWSATTIGPTKGGTGISTYATGDLIYATAADTLGKLAAGTNGHVLTLAAGVPTWAAPTGGSSAWTHATTYTTLDNAGDNVGINAGASPSAKLHVIATTEQLRLGYDASNYATFTVGSTGNLSLSATGVLILDGLYLTTPGGTGNLYLSPTAPSSYSGGEYNVSISQQAGANITSGAGNISIGLLANNALTTGFQNTTVGYRSMRANTSNSNNNVCIGAYTASNNLGTATHNVLVGAYAGHNLGAADHNVYIGAYAAQNANDGDRNVVIGYNAVGSTTALTTGTDVIAIGYGVRINSATASHQLAIGSGTNKAIWSDDYRVGINIGGPDKGQGLGIKTAQTLLSGLSGATATATNLIPAGSTVLGVTIRVTTLITSGDGGTTFTIGDGTDADAWGTGIAFTANTTTTGTAFTVTTPAHYTAATNVVLTCTGGTFSAGAVRVTVHYLDFTAATS